MLELLIAKKIADSYLGNRNNSEHYEEYPNGVKKVNKAITIISWVFVVVFLLFGFVAVWLSWECNTQMGYSLPLKIIFAIGAFFMGLSYIVSYLVMRMDACWYMDKLKGTSF